MPPLSILAGVVVASVVVTSVAWASEAPLGNVRATVVQPASPMAQTVYEWRWSATAPSLSVTRHFAGGFGTETEVGLIGSAAYRAAWDDLAACDQGAVSALAERSSGESGWVIVEQDGAPARFVEDPYGAGLSCLAAVRAPFAGVVDAPPFRNPFWRAGEYGMIQSRTDLPAWVWIDGRPTGLQTPLLEHRVLPGERIIEWRSAAGEVLRRATIQVGAGQTTTINVELNPDPGPRAPFGPPDEWLDSTG